MSGTRTWRPPQSGSERSSRPQWRAVTRPAKTDCCSAPTLTPPDPRSSIRDGAEPVMTDRKRIHLTDAGAARLKPSRTEYAVWDTRVAGLGIRVRPWEHRSFVWHGRASGRAVSEWRQGLLRPSKGADGKDATEAAAADRSASLSSRVVQSRFSGDTATILRVAAPVPKDANEEDKAIELARECFGTKSNKFGRANMRIKPGIIDLSNNDADHASSWYSISTVRMTARIRSSGLASRMAMSS